MDGFLLGSNGRHCPGGGFTIVDENNRLLHHVTMHRQGYTNNDAELWAVAAAAHIANVGDTIRSDSQVMVKWWVPRGETKSRSDLNTLCLFAHKLIADKRLNLIWVRREENKAGLYNENRSSRS